MSMLYFLGARERRSSAIRVEIRNLSVEQLHDVTIKVESRGRTYNLANLNPGEQKHIFAEPVTESHIVAEFTHADGQRQSKTVFGYAEAGYCGRAELTILPENKLRSTEDLGCWSSWWDFL
jgi:hypothetical protein